MFKVKLFYTSSRLLIDSNLIRCQTQTQKRLLVNLFGTSAYKKVFKEEKVVNFTKDQLFDVVSRTDEYHTFIPACHKSITKYKKDNKVYVEMEVGFAPLLEKYISEVTFQQPTSVIARSKNGRLFNNLISKWEFQDLAPKNSKSNSNKKRCLIKFEVEFEFKSKILMKLGMPFFEITAKNTLDAFIERANELYSS